MMNAQLQNVDLRVGGHQVVEVVTSIFHTILFHRSVGKFRLTDGGKYEPGTVGFKDVICDFIDFTYVACTSDSLNNRIRDSVLEFSNELRSCEGNQTQTNGRISLQFYQRQRSFWQLQMERVPWEIWNIDIELIKFNNQFQHKLCREDISQQLTEKIFLIVDSINRHSSIYMPELPKNGQLDTVFDTTFPDVQPYLFNTMYVTPVSGSLLSNTKEQIYRFFNKGTFL